jgi:hypothetical protein
LAAVAALIAACGTALGAGGSSGAAPAASKPPNFVFVLTDDLSKN